MEVLYRSTRGNGSTVTASNAILKGLSEDGGLFVPDQIPVLDVPMEQLAQMSYQEVAYEVMSRFLTDFTEEEKTATQTAVCLVGLLYKMCQVSLVNKASEEKAMNTVNHSAIDESIKEAESVLLQNGL